MGIEWINPAEKLPALGERVLVWAPGGNVKVKEAYRLVRYVGDQSWWWETPFGPSGGGYRMAREGVKAWARMPDPPENV